MPVLAVVHTKGGVGKTTTALNIIVARALAGHRVLAVDGDRQGSLVAALAQRDNREPQIQVVHYPDGQALRQQVSISLARDPELTVVIDAGGRDSTSLRAALGLADIVLVPFMPRSYDVWALSDMSALLADARAVCDVTAYALLTMADPRGSDNADAAEAVPEGLECLPLSIGRRKTIAELAGAGLGVLEMPNRDVKATAEFQALLNTLYPNNN